MNWKFNWSWFFSWTGYNLITLKRLDITDKGVFGHLTMNDFDCVTLERHDTLINPGTYKIIVDMSPHLGYKTPHIIDPERDKAAGGDAGLRIHIANFDNQLEGCVAVGETRDGFAIDDSKITFNMMMSKWPVGEVEITIS